MLLKFVISKGKKLRLYILNEYFFGINCLSCSSISSANIPISSEGLSPLSVPNIIISRSNLDFNTQGYHTNTVSIPVPFSDIQINPRWLLRQNCSRHVGLDPRFRQAAKMKLLLSVFSCLYSRVKIFVFAVNSRRRFSIFM